MTILNLGNTPADFGLSASVVSTAAAGRDAAYSPSSMLCLNAAPIVNIPADAGTDYWFHWRLFWNASTGNSTGSVLRISDAANSLICDMHRLSTNNFATQFRVYGSSVVSGTAFTFVNNTTYIMDLKLTVGASAGNIVAELYINGALHTSVTAVNSGTVKTKPRQLILAFADGLTSAVGINYSEIIATVDESTIGARLATLEPASAGAFATMAGTVAALADADTATGVTSAAVAQRFNSVFSAYGGAATPASIRGVFLKSQASQAGAAAPTQLNQSIRISATNYDGAAQAIVPGVGNIHEWVNNPNTAAPWLVAALAAFEGGLLSAA